MKQSRYVPKSGCENKDFINYRYRKHSMNPINGYAPAGISHDGRALVLYVPFDATDWEIGEDRPGTGILRVSKGGEVEVSKAYGKSYTFNAFDYAHLMSAAQDSFTHA